MSSIINTNSLSLLTQNNLLKSQSSLTTAIQRLSSGLRINSAKDDAAGQAIANRFTANIKALSQSQRNANDGISMAQTTEGALSEINTNLQRVRELTVQAANGSNSAADKVSIQAEIKQRMEEIDRTSRQTDFNGTKVLSATAKSTAIQVGANDGETISIDLKEISSTTLGLGNLDISRTALDLSKVATGATTELTRAGASSTTSTQVVTLKLNNTATSTDKIYVGTANADQLYMSNDGGTTFYSGSYNTTTGELTFDTATATTTVAGTATLATAGQMVSDGAGGTVNVDNIKLKDGNTAAAPTIYVDTAGDFFVSKDSGSTVIAATLVTTGANAGQVTYNGANFSAAASSTNDLATVKATYSIPPIVTAATPAINYDLSAVTTTATITAGTAGTAPSLHALKKADGTADGYVVKGSQNGSDVYYRATFGTGANAGVVGLGEQFNPDALKGIDAALASVDGLRSSLGAVQNRFDSVISNLGTTITNLAASRSRIEDADYAVEVSNMTRSQILQQAGTSVLAKANQSTQGVMSLLQ